MFLQIYYDVIDIYIHEKKKDIYAIFLTTKSIQNVCKFFFFNLIFRERLQIQKLVEYMLKTQMIGIYLTNALNGLVWPVHTFT